MPALTDPPTRAALTLCVPMPPNVTNRARGSTHWRRGWREKHAYWETLDILAGCGGTWGDAARMPPGMGWHLPDAPAVPFDRVTVRSRMVLAGAMDDDNAAARHKHLLDWLVAHGYLASDRRTCVRWEAFPEQTVSRTHAPTICLTLTPVAPGAAHGQPRETRP